MSEQFSFKQRVEKRMNELKVNLTHAKNEAIFPLIRGYTEWILLELAEEFKIQAQSPSIKGKR